MLEYPKFKACAAHVAPIFLDVEATMQKACALTAEAARAGARLIAFPESFVPGFPIWAGVQAPIKNHDFFRRLAANSIEVPGPEFAALCASAHENAITVSIGISERSAVSVGCLWNTNLLIGAGWNTAQSSPQTGADLLRKADLGKWRRRRLARHRYVHRQDRDADLRRKHQSAGALFAHRPRRTSPYIVVSAGLADSSLQRARSLRPRLGHPNSRRRAFIRRQGI